MEPSNSSEDPKCVPTRLFSNRDLFLLIIPLLIEQLLSILAGLVDSLMVASVSEAAVSGVSLIDNIMVLLIQIFAALATGGAVISGQYLGHGEQEKARQGSNDLIWFSGFLSLIVTALLYGGRLFILNVLFGQIEPEVWQHANTYLLITSASVPFVAVYQAGAAVFRTMGNAPVTMSISVLANAINIVGNAICIYGFHMGVAGVAVPTFLSRLISMLLVLFLLQNPELPLSMERKFSHRFDWRIVRRILGIGIPSGLENGLFQLGKILLLSLVSGFGTTSITANAIASILASFQVLGGQATGLAEVTVISRCVGAGDYQQVRYYNKKLLSISYVLLWVTNIALIVFLPGILSLYHLSPETEALTTQIVWIHTIGSSILWPLAFDLPAMFRAAGDVRFTMVVSVVSMWLFRLGAGYFLALNFHFGVIGIWLAMMIDWIFRITLFLWRYFSNRWMNFHAV